MTFDEFYESYKGKKYSFQNSKTVQFVLINNPLFIVELTVCPTKVSVRYTINGVALQSLYYPNLGDAVDNIEPAFKNAEEVAKSAISAFHQMRP